MLNLPNYYITIYSEKEGWQELHDAVATIDEAISAYRDATNDCMGDQVVEVEWFNPDLGALDLLDMDDYA